MEVVLLAIGVAATLAAVDFRYANIGRISSVYYLDAIAERVLVTLWVVAISIEGEAVKPARGLIEND